LRLKEKTMPIYEYEPTEHECQMCPGRFEALQSPEDDALEFCPSCGLPCRRVISRAQFKLSNAVSADDAAKKGFTTYKKAESGVWEKIAGEGNDILKREDT